MVDLRNRVEALWEGRHDLSVDDVEANETIREAIELLDNGEARVAETDGQGGFLVNEWLKLAILLLFQQSQMSTIEMGPFEFADKIPLKSDYQARGVRVVPGASARWGSYQGPGVIMMPSYVNIGAYVGDNTMIDTWATVGSCAQVGRDVHLSGGVGIGGVLEPPHAVPVVIGDECLIGSRCIVAEGARVGDGSVLGAGAVLTGSIPVIEASTGEELSRGEVPPWCVAVPATRPREFEGGLFGLSCVLVVRRLEPGERHDKSTSTMCCAPTGSPPKGVGAASMTDLVALTAELVDIPSVSFDEAALVTRIEAELRGVPGLAVDRVGDNLVARTELDRTQRLVLGGHTDTVPGDTAAGARIDGDTCWGLGSADMKGGLAVMIDLAGSLVRPVVDVTWVFYAREEVASKHNGLRELFAEAPDLLAGDAAVLGEPTGAAIEAGCQGTMRLAVTLSGVRAHSARPWMGRNAVHRLGGLLRTLEAYEYREPVVDGCQYREALQAVRVEGGLADNVVPGSATLVLNHRYAPDRSAAEAEAHVREVLAPHVEDGDTIEVVDHAPAAAPGLDHPLLVALAADLEVRAKLGWTDVAFFAERGVPAVNFGPGDPTLAHTAEERVERRALESTYRALRSLLEGDT